MRYSASSKYEIIKEIENSELGIKRTCVQLGISRSTFYNWLARYQTGGYDALEDGIPCPDYFDDLQLVTMFTHNIFDFFNASFRQVVFNDTRMNVLEP